MSSSTEPRYPIGYISRAHGVGGEVVVVSDSDDELFAIGTTFLTDQDELLTVAGVRRGKHGRIIRFEGIVERDGAEAVRGRTLTIGAAQRRELDEDEYWPEQLIGLAIVTTEGVQCGTVSDVIIGTAQDRIVMAAPGQTVEIPFVDELVPDVDLARGRVVIRPIEGLLNEGE